MDMPDAIMVAPRLLQYVEAEYPKAAFDAGIQADVLAEIDVDEAGKVTAVKITEPKGQGFDEAAHAAMMRFLFSPATVDGVPIPSRVTYKYRFFIEEKKVEPEPAVQEDTDTGKDSDTETDTDTGAVSDDEILSDAEATASFESTVRDKKPSREVTRRVITQQEIAKIPGTGGDALRAVQNLPGMARSAFGGGELIIRGSAPSDSQYFFDGLNAPLLYHFGGLTSIINTDLLESIEYYPGNFSARFGRATGGVIDVKTRAPKSDRWHGYIDADIWDAGALVEGPVGKKWSIALSGRRSYIDAVMNAANLMGDDITLTVAPRYYDFQLVADYHPNTKDNVRLFLYGTDDRWIMNWDGDTSLMGSGLDVHLMTYQAQAAWRHTFTKKTKNELTIGAGYWGGTDNEGIVKQEWNVVPILLRDELSFRPSDRFAFRLGTDTEIRWGKVDMKVPGDYGMEGDTFSPWTVNDKLLVFKTTTTIAEPAMYGEFELNAVPKTQFIYGMRVDYLNTSRRWAADPRVSVRYEVLPKTTLKAGIGLFHQPPDLVIGSEDYGNPDLEFMSAIHYSLGIEQRFLQNFEIGLEGFYKDLNRVFRSSDDMVERDGETVPERYSNDATGRVYGMEVELKHHPTERFFGWISYTLMRSERTEDGVTRLFDFDQTHILNVVGSVNVGWGVQIGLRFRLVSGNPTTPTIGASYDGDSDLYIPIYGKTNSERKPLFHQLDLRIDKKWQWKYTAFTLYLDVQNVYYRKNVEDYAYSYDYKQKEPIVGLPIMPSIGLKLEY
jgi:TonB family protein